jgi:small nuclear ribonucleoprotein (snRNP)-like protein
MIRIKTLLPFALFIIVIGIQNMQPVFAQSSGDDHGQPFRLKDFYASKTALNVVTLNWTMAENWATMNYIAVFRSFDNITYDSIGVRYQTSTLPVEAYYELNDTLAGLRTNKRIFYRLRQVNLQRQGKFSHTIVVNNGESLVTEIYPNPAINYFVFSVKVDFDFKGTVQVIGQNGAVYNTQLRNFNKGMNVFMYNNISNMPKGIYTVSILYKGNIIQSNQLRKL